MNKITIKTNRNRKLIRVSPRLMSTSFYYIQILIDGANIKIPETNEFKIIKYRYGGYHLNARNDYN